MKMPEEYNDDEEPPNARQKTPEKPAERNTKLAEGFEDEVSIDARLDTLAPLPPHLGDDESRS